MARFKQGYFTPRHPEKYTGTLPVKYKSGLEERCLNYFDMNDNVVRYCYEPFFIPYQKPIFENNKIHFEERKYYVDFIVEIRQKNGELKKYIVEVKSKSETEVPKQPKKMTFKNRQRLMEENKTFMVNKCKWETAATWARAHGAEFIHLTSDMIN